MIDLQVEVSRIDWGGSKTHQTCVLYEGGKQLGERSFAHGGEGIGTLFRLFGEFASCGASPVRRRRACWQLALRCIRLTLGNSTISSLNSSTQRLLLCQLF